MLHIGPGVFEVVSASKGLLLEVVEMEKKGKKEKPGGKMCRGRKEIVWFVLMQEEENEQCINLSSVSGWGVFIILNEM